MQQRSPTSTRDGALILLVALAATAARYAWLAQPEAQRPRVQWSDDALSTSLAKSLAEREGFRGRVPFGPEDRRVRTAWVSPGYPCYLSWFYKSARFAHPRKTPDAIDRTVAGWVTIVQAGMGVLSALGMFFLARSIFQARAVATLAGLAGGLHYHWLASTAERADGALVTLLVVWSLVTALRFVAGPSWRSAVCLGLLLGLTSLSRASLLGLAWGVLLWSQWKLRRQAGGWAWSLTALGVFLATLAPWTLRNAKVYGRLIPVSSRTGLDVWWGSHEEATGGAVLRPAPDEAVMTDAVSAVHERIAPLSGRGRELAGLTEPTRFGSLLREAVAWPNGWAWRHPGRYLALRVRAGVFFFTGQAMWLDAPPQETEQGDVFGPSGLDIPGSAVVEEEAVEADEPPRADDEPLEPSDALNGDEAEAASLPEPDAIGTTALLAMFVLAVAGRRLSRQWRPGEGILTLALITAALPSVLTYGDLLHGARMPIDGVFLVYAGFATACLIPGYGRRLRRGFQEPTVKATDVR